MCNGFTPNGKPLNNGTSRETANKSRVVRKPAKKSPGSQETVDRRYQRCVAKERVTNPSRTETESSRGKKFSGRNGARLEISRKKKLIKNISKLCTA